MVPMAAVKGWLGADIRAALAALEAMPLHIPTHRQWMEARRNLLNAKKSIEHLERLSRWVAGGPGEIKRELKGTNNG